MLLQGFHGMSILWQGDQRLEASATCFVLLIASCTASHEVASRLLITTQHSCIACELHFKGLLGLEECCNWKISMITMLIQQLVDASYSVLM